MKTELLLIRLLALFGLVIAYLLATAYDFSWLQNDASFQVGRAAFTDRGIVRSLKSPPWLESVKQSGTLSLTLEIEPASRAQDGPARILTISHNSELANMTVAQQDTHLLVRVGHTRNMIETVPRYEIRDVFSQPKTVSILIKTDSKTIIVSIDGDEVIEESIPASTFSSWEDEYYLALGNELTWELPWRGTITHAAIVVEGKSHDLLSTEEMIVPNMPRLRSRIQLFAFDKVDLLINLFAMIPFGFLWKLLARNWSTRIIALFWLPICMLAEGQQLFLAGRFATVSDLVLNLVGIVIGAWLYSQLDSLKSIENIAR